MELQGKRVIGAVGVRPDREGFGTPCSNKTVPKASCRLGAEVLPLTRLHTALQTQERTLDRMRLPPHWLIHEVNRITIAVDRHRAGYV